MSRAGEKVAAQVAKALTGAHYGPQYLVGICSALNRHAVSYQRIQERWCNDEMTDQQIEELEAFERKVEKRVRAKVAMLPKPDGVHEWSVIFEGDPRGCVVKLVAPPGYEHVHDTWTGDGIGLPEVV